MMEYQEREKMVEVHHKQSKSQLVLDLVHRIHGTTHVALNVDQEVLHAGELKGVH